jgi:hypothetical protein
MCYVLSVSIISKLINTCTSIVQHFYCEIVKFITQSTQRLATKLKTHLAVITDGLTSQLQPLDVSVNKPFKGFMHEEWTKLHRQEE